MSKDKFEYSYVAPTERERKEAEALKRRYAVKEKQSDAFSRLRALDKKVQTPPKVWALSLGIFGTLIFGVGLTMILEWNALPGGVAVAVVGMLPVVLAYPVYKRMREKLSDKYRAEILQLSEEILNNGE